MFTCHGDRDVTFARPQQQAGLPCVQLRLLLPAPLQENEALNEMAHLVQLQSAQVQELDAECVMLRGCLECVLRPSAPVHARHCGLEANSSRCFTVSATVRCLCQLAAEHLSRCSCVASHIAAASCLSIWLPVLPLQTSHIAAASCLSIWPPVLPLQACGEAMPGAPAAAGAAAAPRQCWDDGPHRVCTAAGL